MSIAPSSRSIHRLSDNDAAYSKGGSGGAGVEKFNARLTAALSGGRSIVTVFPVFHTLFAIDAIMLMAEAVPNPTNVAIGITYNEPLRLDCAGAALRLRHEENRGDDEKHKSYAAFASFRQACVTAVNGSSRKSLSTLA